MRTYSAYTYCTYYLLSYFTNISLIVIIYLFRSFVRSFVLFEIPASSLSLFLSLSEWEPNYVPRQMHTPGLGIKDFVSDVGQIVKNRSGRSRKGRKSIRRKKRGSNSPKNAGLYHMPGTASIVSSQYDGLEGPSGVGMDTFDDDTFDGDAFDGSYDSSNNDDDKDEYPIEEEPANTTYDADRTATFGNNNFPTQNLNNGGASLSHGHKNRRRIMSGSSGNADDEDDSDSDDIELL